MFVLYSNHTEMKIKYFISATRIKFQISFFFFTRLVVNDSECMISKVYSQGKCFFLRSNRFYNFDGPLSWSARGRVTRIQFAAGKLKSSWGHFLKSKYHMGNFIYDLAHFAELLFSFFWSFLVLWMMGSRCVVQVGNGLIDRQESRFIQVRTTKIPEMHEPGSVRTKRMNSST